MVNKKMSLTVLVFLLGMGCISFAEQIIYVDGDANGLNNGSSWVNAYKYLQDGLTVAQSGDEIWVAEGTYKPDEGAGQEPNDREATFQMKSGVAIYGGFPSASEPNLSDPNWNDRDPNAHETILSGNINRPWQTTDNSYHVVTGSGTDETAVLDGFTITSGKANGAAPYNSGGGIYDSYMLVANCKFVGNSAEYGGGISYCYGPVTNCTFIGNTADEQGGGIYRNYGPVTDCSFNINWANDGGGIYRNNGHVTNCVFNENSAGNNGGGIYDNYGAVTHCTFCGNSANGYGGGIKYNHAQIVGCIFNGNSTIYGGGIYRNYQTVSNCTLASNTAYSYGGGIYDNYGAVTNCILWFNSDSSGTGGAAQIRADYWEVTYCCLPGWWDRGNIGLNPLFADPCGSDGIIGTEDDDLRLGSDSPCIDAGDNTGVSTDAADLDNDANTDERIPYDIDGWLRFVDDPCRYDIGVADPPAYPDIVDMGAHERRVLYPANYDLVRSGYVDWRDIGAFADEWSNDCNWSNNWCGWIDFDKSGRVDFSDFALFAQHWLSDFLGEPHKLEWDDVMGRDWQLPAKLNDFIGVHPRYLLNDAKITALKTKVDTPGTMQEYIWLNVVKPMADWYLTESPYGYSNEDVMRPSGRAIPWLALAYLMADEPDKTIYKNKAISWMLTVCGYSRWDNNYSLGAAAGLVGVSIGYDWLYDELSDSQRSTIKNKLIYQSQRMAPNPQHKEHWLANHNHVEHNGLAAAAFVLYGEPGAEEAADWIRQADIVFQMAFLTGSSEGSSTEGHQYWGYSMESLLCYTEAARDLMGVDYYDRNWVKSAADFIIFCTIPDFNMITGIPEKDYSNCVMGFGDSYRDYRSHGPTHILCRVASEYNDGRAQWLAEEMLARGVGITDIDYRGWANLLWYDENVTATSLSGLPTFKHFEDIGLVVSRSGWDEDAVMVGFKCGPFHGHKVQPYYEKQYAEGWPYYHTIVNGHGHPDVGSFQVYAHGKWLATEPGYSKYTSTREKYTYDHCTMLAGGLGQWGEGDTWFDGEAVIDANASSSITKAESCAEYDYIVGDAKNIYRDGGLSKFIRHFVYIKPDVIVIADELEASPSANYFQWRLRAIHARQQFVDDVNIVEQDPNEYYIIENNNDMNDVVVMDVHFVRPDLANFSTDIESITQYQGHESKFLVADFDSTSGGDMLATVLHPRRDEEPACSITSSSFVGSVLYLTIEIGAETINVELDLPAQEVTIY
jgi:hypothetical protein